MTNKELLQRSESDLDYVIRTGRCVICIEKVVKHFEGFRCRNCKKTYVIPKNTSREQF